jgi:hypothetical protein
MKHAISIQEMNYFGSFMFLNCTTVAVKQELNTGER